MKPKKITGRAYLFRVGKFDPVHSVDIEADRGKEYIVAAHKLLEQFRIEFEPNDSDELVSLIMEEVNA